MTEAGFFEPKRISPTGLTIVIALHAAGLAAVILAKNPTFIRHDYGPTTVIDVPPLKEPPPNKPEPETKQKPYDREADPYAPDPVFDHSFDRAIETQDDVILPPPPTEPIDIPPPQPPVAHDPVRTEAAFDPRFADQLRPPYPLSEVRNEIEGVVTLRLLIGADGRVKSAERVAATNDAFFQAAQRQALRAWRFRPATVDGKPVESSKQMTLRFELDR